MKMEKRSLRFLITIIFTVLFTLSAADIYGATISFMLGDVKIIRGKKKISADVDMKLKPGDMIKTGRDGVATVQYEDGSEVRVQESSWIKVGNKSSEDMEFVSVVSGLIKAKFSKVKRGGERKVYTPTTVCSVRGTEFLVGVSEGADSRVALTEGKLDVKNPYGKTKMKENQKVDVGVAKAPKKKKGFELSMEDLNNWKANSDKKFEENPEKNSNAFEKYIDNFNKRSKKNSKKIDKLEKKQGQTATMGKRKLKKANEDADKTEDEAADDLFLCDAAGNSIDGILNKFKKDKKGMYDKYLQIKKESNRVQDQLKKNYEAIQAVKAAYKKAYDEIMGKHKSYKDQILKGYKKDSVKPK